MNIKTTLAMASFVNIVLVSFLSLSCYIYLQNLSHRFADIADTTVPTTVLLERMHQNLHTLSDDASVYVVTNDDLSREKYLDGMRRFTDDEVRLKALMNNGRTAFSAEDDAFLKQLDAAKQALEKEVDLLSTRYNQNDVSAYDETDRERIERENIASVTEKIESMIGLFRDQLTAKNALLLESERQMGLLLDRARIRVILFGSLVIACSLAINIFVFLSIFRPLGALSTAARSVADGNYTVRVDTHRTDEFGMLEKSFDEMTQVLETLKGDFETKLAERTRELETAKASLESTNAKINRQMAEVESMNALMVNRELKMAELKEEVKKLRQERGAE